MPDAQPPPTTAPEGGIDLHPIPTHDPADLGASCDPGWSVTSDGAALLVRDPEVLSRFALERVLAQILDTAGTAAGELTSEDLLRRLFDTENTAAGGVFGDNVHCDDTNNAAFVNAPPVNCPRVEGELASSAGLFVAGDPDYFAPVAIVNRFDLLPSDFSTCGEYRIVYAKWSGRTDPNDRVFLIFEAALPNPEHTLAACRAVAELLADVDGASGADVAERLEAFYFEGLPDFEPVVHAEHYTQVAGDCSYSARCGQVRVGQGMQTPWEFRQFRLTPEPVHFAPVVVSNSPLPESLDPAATWPEAETLRAAFLSQVANLARPGLRRIRVRLDHQAAGQSALSGLAQPNYLARVVESADGAEFVDQIAEQLVGVDTVVCGDDPITPASILKRATALTCAGCHAPEALLGPDRTVGCGLVWPHSLGEAHIDEHGVLSDALTKVFLPDRAAELTAYLRACDKDAILDNLEPAPSNVHPECFVAGTPITMADGSTKPIEQIALGELVLSFDAETGALVPAEVVRSVERLDADRLVVINESLIATTNHPFYSAGRWVRAGDLQAGAPLFEVRDADPTRAVRLELTTARVDQLVLEPGSVPTYNLEVQEHHSYFAGGLLVHDRP
jgi:hypothetical protein